MDKATSYNYVTRKYDVITDYDDAEILAQHLPEIGARGLFNIYVETLHMKPIEAYLNVLHKMIQEPEPYPVPEFKADES